MIAAALAGAAAAYAHAHLDRANPAAGATLAAAPTEVTLHFTQQLEPKFSTIVVRDAAGKQVDKGEYTFRVGNYVRREFGARRLPGGTGWVIRSSTYARSILRRH